MIFRSRIRRVSFAAICMSNIVLSTASATSSGRHYSFLTRAQLKPDLKKTVGEDAHFSAPYDVGAFDGVGGWRDSGVDVSLFSNSMAKSFSEYAQTNHNKDTDLDLVKGLKHSIRTIRENQITGSSTVVIASLNSAKQHVDILNLGDSGAIIYRPLLPKTPVIFETKALTHGFNFPYQVGNIADALKTSKSGHDEPYGDAPTDAVITRIEIKPFDIILLATDGLLDNMHATEIQGIVHNYFHSFLNQDDILKLREELYSSSPTSTTTQDATSATTSEAASEAAYKKLQLLAGERLEAAVSEIVTKTLAYSIDKKYMSPFALEYKKELEAQLSSRPDYMFQSVEAQQKILQQNMYKGGKPDDITVSLSMIL